jgi:Gram-negative bacterial TonB protein C-terminal
MTSVTASVPGFRAPRDPGQRLTLSLALSVAAHLIVIAMLAGLLEPLLTPVLGRVGQALPIEVAIVGVRPIAFTAPPEAPAPASELPMAPQRPGSAPALRTAPVLSPPQAEVPAQPFGVSVQADVNAETLSADAPPPPGDVSVGAIIDSERLGHAQALRLAQRFPRTAAKPPRLREPLIAPYPPRAARAHAEARIAVLLLLDATGRVVDTTLFPDESLFGPAIVDALNGARFAPAEADAKPMPYWMILEFVFSMRPVAKPRPPA